MHLLPARTPLVSPPPPSSSWANICVTIPDLVTADDNGMEDPGAGKIWVNCQPGNCMGNSHWEGCFLCRQRGKMSTCWFLRLCHLGDDHHDHHPHHRHGLLLHGKLSNVDDNDSDGDVDYQGDGDVDDDGDGSGACLQSSRETMEPLGRSGEWSKVFPFIFLTFQLLLSWCYPNKTQHVSLR